MVSTAEAFRAGHVAFIRRDNGCEGQLALVYCQGYELSTGMLRLQWSTEASTAGPAPDLAAEVKCHMVSRGVLYQVQGRVAQMSDGPLPMIDLRVGPNCIAVALRRHQRYSVLGCLRLGEPGLAGTYNMRTFEPMDLSTGGFGIHLPVGDWKIGAHVPFALKALAEKNGAPIIELPSLELMGKCIVKRRTRSAGDRSYSLGFGFSQLSLPCKSTLDCWVSSYSVHLREV